MLPGGSGAVSQARSNGQCDIVRGTGRERQWGNRSLGPDSEETHYMVTYYAPLKKVLRCRSCENTTYAVEADLVGIYSVGKIPTGILSLLECIYLEQILSHSNAFSITQTH